MNQWHSLSHFIAMDGYGLYIWGSYGLTLLCLLAEPLLTLRRQRRAWLAATTPDEDL